MDSFLSVKKILEDNCYAFLAELKKCKPEIFLFRGYRKNLIIS